MKTLIIFFLTLLLLASCGSNNKNSKTKTDSAKTVAEEFIPGNTIKTRFPLPEGWEHAEYDKGSFADWLQNLPLKPVGYQTHLYNGELKPNKVASAVIDMDIDSVDLQQCANAVIRLRAEYLFEQKRYVKNLHFHLIIILGKLVIY